MNLLSQIQNKINGRTEDKPSSPAESKIEQLKKLPESEKLKVLDYLQSLQSLHEPQ